MNNFKQIVATDKFGWHKALLEIYWMLFKGLENEPGSVLEIGCDGGGGILMYWAHFCLLGLVREYVSVDISPRPESLNGEINHHQMDAYTPRGIEVLSKHAPYAWMTDDGPHTLGSQQFFCANHVKMLSPFGIAVVEDIQDAAYVRILINSLPSEFFGIAIDARHYGRYDDLILAIWRR